jgi:predicted  nucleic acid-binding Zn-ribbon protein
MNHIPDTGKMVSDTPRTDAAKFWSDIGGWVTPASKFMELERELNAAKQRIKQLEAKVDELHDLEKWLEGR